MRVYFEQVFQAAEFLQYEATEQLVMNFHPDILSQAAFLDKPRTRKELYRIVGITEEKISILKERGRSGQVATRGNDSVSSNPKGFARGRPRAPATGSIRCWDCGQLGHIRRGCPLRSEPPGNAQRPEGRSAPGQRSWVPFVKLLPCPPMRVMLQLKGGKWPALVDTAQFFCVRSDVAEFLYLTGEPCVLSLFCGLSTSGWYPLWSHHCG
jgi:hypothetical protein